MDLQSLGHAAATFQRAPRVIELALQAVQNEAALACGETRSRPGGPRAVLTLNGLKYYRADEIASAIAWLAKADAERARKKAEADDDA
jgi:hypothetical protein